MPLDPNFRTFDSEFQNPSYSKSILLVKCIEFITSFSDPTLPEDPIHGKHKYMIQMVSENHSNFLQQRVANKEANVINIELDDISDFFR